MVGANVTFRNGKNITLYGDWKGQLKELQDRNPEYRNIEGLTAFSGTSPTGGSSQGRINTGQNKVSASPVVIGDEYALGSMRVSSDVYENFSNNITKEGGTFEINGKKVTPEQFFRARQFKENPYEKLPRFTQKEVNKMEVDTPYISGTSMQQTIPDKSYFVENKVNDVRNIPIGTIIRYKNPSEKLGTTVHRIIGKTDNGNYIVLGDNNVLTEIVRPEDVRNVIRGLLEKKARSSGSVQGLTDKKIERLRRLLSKPKVKHLVNNFNNPKVKQTIFSFKRIPNKKVYKYKNIFSPVKKSKGISLFGKQKKGRGLLW